MLTTGAILNILSCGPSVGTPLKQLHTQTVQEISLPNFLAEEHSYDLPRNAGGHDGL